MAANRIVKLEIIVRQAVMYCHGTNLAVSDGQITRSSYVILDYGAGGGTFAAWRASSFHSPFCFCHTCRTNNLVVPGLPPSLVAALRICRTRAVLPTNFTVCWLSSMLTKSDLPLVSASMNSALVWITPLECP